VRSSAEVIVKLVVRDGWRQQARCHVEKDVPDFFPREGDGLALIEAKLFCATCAVQGDCLAFAITFDDDELPGVWGGLSEEERKVWKERRAA
jgi:hypothetical protein